MKEIERDGLWKRVEMGEGLRMEGRNPQSVSRVEVLCYEKIHKKRILRDFQI